ncbi:hypothetical protein R3W88_015696 [Solanum pinnatisectum]|uniref:Uncharacterized protein n=1 Tax=Solanum pinnatisectum TaxID=50273 RepID=A0AAV9KWI0_9SOLN|nr:hypothetical protein R3W88_015696 [Solanum pinnatisectum]
MSYTIEKKSSFCSSGYRKKKREAEHEIGGGEIFDKKLLDLMDGGRALQLKHEINVK